MYYMLTFKQFLKQNKSVLIHQRNLQILATEIFKTKNGLNRVIMEDVFNFKNLAYNFRNAETLNKSNVIIPYVQGQRKELGKPKQAALVIMDVFQGQITDDVISLLRDNNIHYVFVPNNMTQLFVKLEDLVLFLSYIFKLFVFLYKLIENSLVAQVKSALNLVFFFRYAK